MGNSISKFVVTLVACGQPLSPPLWPKDVPKEVSEFWSKTECPALFKDPHPSTITVPQAVDSWYVATGNAFFATKFPGSPFPTIIPDPGQIPAISTAVPPLAGTSLQASILSQTNKPSLSLTNTVTIAVITSEDHKGSSGSVPASSLPVAVPSITSASSGRGTADTSSSSTLENSPPLGSSPEYSSRTVSPNTSTSTAPPSALAAKSNKTIPIVIGVVVPLVLITLGVAAFILYKRRQRARDRREWERTHEAIADAVRQVGAPAAAGLPAWNPSRGDLKEPLDGDTTPLFDKSGRSYPGV